MEAAKEEDIATICTSNPFPKALKKSSSQQCTSNILSIERKSVLKVKIPLRREGNKREERRKTRSTRRKTKRGQDRDNIKNRISTDKKDPIRNHQETVPAREERSLPNGTNVSINDRLCCMITNS